MASQLDIHNYDRRYERVIIALDNPVISRKNKKLILAFDKACVLESLSKPRRIKIIETLVLVVKNYLKKDLEQATQKDLMQVVATIQGREDYSPWTKQSYRSILKKFYKWLKYGDNYQQRHEYPKIVSWIVTNIKSKDKPKIEASALLAEEEIEKLLKVAVQPRDKAFISMLYELGARIGEIGNLRVKDVVKDKYSFIVNLRGKTGQRTPRIVISDPHVTA
jgi:integrase